MMENNTDVTLSAKKRALMLLKLRKKVANKKAANGLDALVKQERPQKIPLSFAQQRLWFLNQLDQAAGASYHMPAALKLIGALDKAALRKTLNQIVQRHEPLRTTFSDEMGEPYQVIAQANCTFALTEVDLCHLAGDELMHTVENVCQQEVETLFDLSTGPLIRGQLIQLAHDEHVLLITQHHIISDGWSINILIQELSAIYNGYINQQIAQLPALTIQYADYAIWQRNWLQDDNREQQLSFWRQYLKGAPDLLTLPYDKTRPVEQSFNGHDVPLHLPAELTASLRAFSQHHGVTLFMTMLTVWSVMLAKLSGHKEIVTGTPIANRPRKDLEPLMGYFANTLALRVSIDDSQSVKDLLAQVKQNTVSAYQHQNLPFDLVVEAIQPVRDLGYSPIYQVMLSMNNTPGEGELTLEGLRLEPVEQEQTRAQFDLSLSLTDMGSYIGGNIQYVTDLFEQATIERYVEYFKTLLVSITRDDRQCVGDLTMLSIQERTQLVDGFNQTAQAFDLNQSVHACFEQQVALTPNKTAIKFGQHTLTYTELNQQANQLARLLKAKGVEPESKVALFVERGCHAVVCMLAVLKSGGCYVPVDPTYPSERIAHILEDSAPIVVLSEQALANQISTYDVDALLVDHPSTLNELTAYEPSNLAVSTFNQESSLAYIIYTSGSTGKPKGVMVEHRNVVNLIFGHIQMAELTADDVILQFASYSFDVAVGEIFPALVVGATLVIRPSDIVIPDQQFSNLIDQNHVSVCDLPTAFWQQWVQLLNQNNKQVNPSLRLVIAGGEKADAQHVKSWFNVCQQCDWINGYGPTEASVTATSKRYAPDSEIQDVVSIGTPLANVAVYILDQNMQLAPLGAVGEIYIGGDSVARGYLNRPELTAEKFIDSPFEQGASLHKNKLYKTGDLGRWKANGDIEYCGRNDFQVKIRGFRIELGEIENQLLAIDEVSMAYVTDREHTSGEKFLVAYVIKTPDSTLSIEKIRTQLRTTLAEYMVPSAFVFIEHFPLTPNGKIDKAALPQAEYAVEQSTYVAPRNDTEKKLADIWQRLLGLKQVGLNDHFFNVGGHSLLAVQLISRVAQTFHVDVELKQLFANPVLADFAHLIAHSEQRQLPIIERADRGENIPASYAQQRLWLIDQLNQDQSSSGGSAQNISATYHMTAGLHIKGPLNKLALQQALNSMLVRHESLRTTFKAKEGAPVQVIAPETMRFELDEMDLQNVEHGPLKTEAIEAACERYTLVPFNLAHGPLIRALLIQSTQDEYVLLVVQHHIITDGWSVNVFISEVTALYDAYQKGQANPLPALPIQYADYSAWQRAWLNEDKLAEQKTFWCEYLAESPEVIQLPLDRPRTQQRTYQGASVDLTIPRDVVQRLKAMSEAHGATLFMTLLSAWSGYLSKITGQTDIVVGTPVANRPSYQLEPLIGFFVNTLALRFNLDSELTVADIIAKGKENIITAFSHQDLPFEQVVELVQPHRSLSHTPLFQVLFNWESEEKSGDMSFSELEVTPLSQASENTQFDLSLFLKDTGDSIIGSWRYTTDLFDAQTIEHMSANFAEFLKGFSESEDKKFNEIAFLAAEQQQDINSRFNGVIASEQQHDLSHDLLHKLFEQQALANPNHIAVEAAGHSLTYKALNERANQVAHLLVEQGVKPDNIVALCFDRSIEMLAALMGVLKAGAAYLPLDPSTPLERIQYIVNDSNAVCVLAHQATKVIYQHLDCPVCDIDGQTWLAIDRYPNHVAPDIADLNASNLAYVIYTSGSTGMAKGVMLEHRSPVNFWRAMEAAIYHDIPTDARVALNASYAFDMSLKGILQLLSGRTLVLIPQDIRADGQAMVSFLVEHCISAFDCTPSQLALLLKSDLMQQPHYTPSAVLIGGEALDKTMWDELATYANTRFFNMYGPTECTIDVTIGQISNLARQSHIREPHIGKPIQNMNVHIVDQAGLMVPVGVIGELCVSGLGVARGYLNRNELTHEKFLSDGLSNITSRRVYKTGDLARWQADGTIEYIGRNDNQIKIRGFRIEKGEIEARLASLNGIEQAVVTVCENKGDEKLVAYYTTSSTSSGFESELSSTALSPAEIRAKLALTLAEYMIPTAFVCLETLPLNKNGKLDIQALPAPDSTSIALQEYIAPVGQVEQVIADIWQNLLNVERVGRQDNFFALGGHSLLGIMLLSKIKQELAVDVPLRVLFETPQLISFAEAIGNDTEEVTYQHLVKIRTSGTQAPLFLIHPSEGEVAYAYDMSAHLSDDRPIYALAATGLNEHETPITSVEAMAEAYIEEIRSVQPQGPYYLAGWSAGGTIAYEMAYQLIGADQVIGFLGVFDSASDYQILKDQFRPLCGDDLSTLTFNQWIQSLAWLPHTLAEAEKIQVARLLRTKNLQLLIEYCQSKLILPQGVGADVVKRHMQLYYTMSLALAAYDKPALPIEICAFSAQEEDRKQRPMDWYQFAPTKVVKVPGNHFSMMAPDNISQLAQRLEQELTQFVSKNSQLPEYGYQPDIAIQGGQTHQAPIFCIPGAGASVTSYAMLAQALGNEYPIIGLQPRGLCGGMVPHSSVESAARFYCQQLLAMNLKQPIRLIGHSYGGWVATELASLLTQAGQQVSFLGVLDSPAPLLPEQIKTRYSHIEMLMRLVEIYDMSISGSMQLTARDFIGKTYEEQINVMLQRLIQTGIVPRTTNASLLKGVVNVFKANLSAGYKPANAYKGEVNLVLVPSVCQSDKHAAREIEEITHQWQTLSPNTTQWTGPGNHITLLSMPNVTEVAHWLTSKMRT